MRGPTRFAAEETVFMGANVSGFACAIWLNRRCVTNIVVIA